MAALCATCGRTDPLAKPNTKILWKESMKNQSVYRYGKLDMANDAKPLRVPMVHPDPFNGPAVLCEMKLIDLNELETQSEDENKSDGISAPREHANGTTNGSRDTTSANHDGNAAAAASTRQVDGMTPGSGQNTTDRPATSNPTRESPTAGPDQPTNGTRATTTQHANTATDAFTQTQTAKGKSGPEWYYEALSWSWGANPRDTWISIESSIRLRNDITYTKLYKKAVTSDLHAALRALKFSNEKRYLWIDAICINLEDIDERNHQVEMMASIYGYASRVCIRIGVGDPKSDMAMDFIRYEVLQLQNFDTLCESKDHSKKWDALLNLMRRPWFSRRWIVQEVALAGRAVLYCGSKKISWKKFAIAVELFIEGENATHRLSEVMKRDENFDNVRGWFEHILMLGASLLVEATGKLYCDWRPNDPAKTDDPDSDSDDRVPGMHPALRENKRGDALLTLEYLVSNLSIFQASRPHDAIYAMLAIAKDVRPKAAKSHQPKALGKAKKNDTSTPEQRLDIDVFMDSHGRPAVLKRGKWERERLLGGLGEKIVKNVSLSKPLKKL
jgi:Heterokaryon incompatibility protein (HET)